MLNKKGFIGVTALIAIVLALVVIGGGVYYLMHQNTASQNLPVVSTIGQTQDQTPTQTVNTSTEQPAAPEATTYGATNNSVQTPATSNTTTPSSAPSGMQVYIGNGFSIQYPSGVKINTTPTPLQSFTANINDGIQLVAIGPIDQNFAVTESDWGTNGVVTIDGSVTVGLSTNATDVANCMTAPNGAEEGGTNVSTENINGINFLSYEIDQPAAGQLGLDHTYTTLRNGTCYSIDENIDGFESSHMTTTDGAANDAATQQLSNELDSIAKSFTFTGSTAAMPPTCSLSSDKTTYQRGDVITLTWQSQNAQSALWKSAVDSNTGYDISNVVPEGKPATNGSATTIADLTGSQMITLQVTGSGGLGQCTADFNVNPSSAAPSMTVNGVSFNPSGQYNNNNYSDVTLSGTITNGALYNDEVNIVLEDSTYTGPFDYNSIYSSANKQYFWSGGSTPGARDDSQAFKQWSAETFVAKGATQVRVLVYPFFYNRTDASAYQPIINQLFTISQ